MQLEAGKAYTDRRGRVYGPLIQNSTCFGEGPNNYAWSAEGRISSSAEYDMDLVAEYVEPVKAAEPECRMLQPGEPFQDGDEYRDINGKWCKAPKSANRTFDPQIYFPHRRLVKPAPVESPDDLVIQDRVPAREGIDFGWNVGVSEFADHKPRIDDKWSIGPAYAGRMHGAIGGPQGDSKLRLAVMCYRKDLPPVESPDEWVTQDRVPARVGLDEEYWSNWRQGAWSAVSAGQMSYSRKMSHGDVDHMGDKLSLRCRRKDLPPVPPKTRTVVLKEWICWDDCGPVVLLWQDVDPTTDGIEYNNFQHAVETGNTRTVEIPVT